MKNKQTTLGEFAEYAKNIHKYRNDMSSYQQLVEYIRSLFEVSRDKHYKFILGCIDSVI